MKLHRAFVFLFFLEMVFAIMVNVTIDDTLGDSATGAQFTYLPTGGWSFGPTCQACTATPHLNASGTLDKTWHDGTSNGDTNNTSEPLRLASVPFYGTAVYVYCVLSNTETVPDGYSDMTFLIDSHPAGTFVHVPQGGPSLFTYNVSVFANDSLPNGNHTLTIQNGVVGGPKSLVLLDYVVYSYDNGNPTVAPKNLSKKNNSSKIVGGVLGTICILLLGLLGFLWHRQRSYKASISSTDDVSCRPPFGHFVTNWFPKWRSESKLKSNDPPRNSFAFNSSLFVLPIRSRFVAHAHPATPAVVTILPRGPLPDSPNSSHPLQPNRDPPPLNLDSHHEPATILEWRQRTLLEADAMPPRLSVVEADLSSYYEFSTVTHEPAPRTSRPGPRRFTVMNN